LAAAREKRTGGAIRPGLRPEGELASGPSATSCAFGRALLAGDPRGAASCLAANATVLSADGTELAGREQAFELLSQITSSEQELEIRIGRCVVADGIALATQYWRRSTPGPGGHSSSTIARLVMVRRGPRWQIVIASPWE
jgi:ketosteroid isomerase-like protein